MKILLSSLRHFEANEDKLLMSSKYEIELVIFHILNSTIWMTNFSMIFYFSLKNFHWKFSKYLLWVCRTMYKFKKEENLC